jgi:hypothetical protein
MHTEGDPWVEQSQMTKILSFLPEARLPTIPRGSVDDQLEEEMDQSTTYWKTRPPLDVYEGPSPLLGGPMVDHHRRLVAAHQVWLGPYWTIRTQRSILFSQSRLLSEFTQNQNDPSLDNWTIK